MPELPTCSCVRGLPPYDRLTAIYQAAAELSGDASLPDARCVAGVPPFDRFAYIYAAFRVLADDDTLPSMECVEGEPPADRVARIYQAAAIYADDSDLPEYRCVRGLPIWQQWREIYRALYVSAGSPVELADPRCVSTTFDVLSDVFCALLVQENAPQLLLAVISVDGLQLTLTVNQPVTLFSADAFTLNGTAAALEDLAGSGTTQLVFNLSDVVDPGAIITLDYAPNDEFDTVFNLSGDPMAAFVDFPVQNNSGNEFFYLRPGGVDTYLRPGGVDTYIRP